MFVFNKNEDSWVKGPQKVNWTYHMPSSCMPEKKKQTNKLISWIISPVQLYFIIITRRAEQQLNGEILPNKAGLSCRAMPLDRS